ncbi:MAG TPA: protein-glutamate O-methyltransferase CheR [Xanthobacteraceae bacterium]|nr:protein-glutamate O-methyltransferase CheR [Xanthobacteraceae bacterium]
MTRQDLERFRSAIVEQVGLHFDDSKLSFLEEVLRRRIGRLACSSADYLAKLVHEMPHAESLALAEELTVAETYFFRHNDQFRALAEFALPDRMRARAASRTLNLMSAGCASGEEAYSIAIVVRETVTDPSWNVMIQAVDLNRAVLQKAEKARYSAWALRETPLPVREKWFRCEGRELALDEPLRRAVHFKQANLASDDLVLWQPAIYDVIFCRNVLMYFAPDRMRAAIARIAVSLAPGGYLFLGHAETLRGVSDDFELHHAHDAFYYRRKDELRPKSSRPDVVASRAVAPAPLPALANTAWVDAIRQASERITDLVPASAKKLSPRRHATWQLAPALDLLRAERFDEALAHVRSGPPESRDDPDVLLVKAVLLAQSGQSLAAEEVCQQLLLIDGLNAGAHYVLALCREHAGERERAVEHDRLAAHLDPAFAMPRLHSGLLARQAGNREVARSELAQALLLLKREDVSRVLLFGGGFSREALIALCQSAVTECGGRL